MFHTLLLSAILTAPPAPPVTAAAYSPDGKTLVAGTRGEVAIIDAATGETQLVHKTLLGRTTAIAWASNERFAVAAGEPGRSGVLRVYDLGSVRPVATWNAHADSVFALAFSNDGKSLVSAGYDRVIKIWDVGGDTSKPKAELKDHSDAIYALSLSPDGKLLASGSADRAVKVWNLATGKRLYTLGDSTDWVYALSWSPDGSRLAAAGVDKSLRVWKADAKGGVLERSAFAHGGPVVKLAFTAESTSIVTAGEDRVVKVWDAGTLKERATFPAQPEAILSLAVSRTAKHVAVGRFDGSLVVLDLPTGEKLQTPVPYKFSPPKIASASPSFLPRGRTTTVTFTGTALDRATSVAAKGATIKTHSATATSLTADVTVPATHSVGTLSLVMNSESGPSAPVMLTVERFPAVSEMKGTVPLDSTLVGTLGRAGEVASFHFEVIAGQQVGVSADAKFAPVLAVTGPEGNVLAESMSGSLGVVCPSPGTYGLTVRDRDYRGGAEMRYRISFGAVPVVTSVFPPAVAKGTKTTVHVSGVHLTAEGGGRSVPVSVPADETKMSLDLASHLALPEKPAGTTTVAIDSLPAVVAHGTEALLPKLPYAADGVLASHGSAITVKFTAKKGEPLVVEGLARRYGSPADPRIEIVNAAGKPVPRATFRCVAKTYLTFRDHDSAKPGLRLETWNELTANDLVLIDRELVKIRQLPGHPDADCDFFAVNGARTTFLDTNPTHHAVNSPMYKVEVHPAGVTFPPNGMPVFRLDYRNDDGGPGYGKDARLFFTAPADGEYRVRLTDARGFGGTDFVARVVVRPPSPAVKVSFSPTAPKVWKGGTVPVAVNVERIDGFEGPVRVEFADLPKGFSSAPTWVGPGFYTTTLGLSAATDAENAKAPLKLVATYSVGDVKYTLESVGKPFTAVEPGDLLTTLKSQSLTVKPGGETRFVVAIERRNGFKGRVPIDVRGLPHGVQVQNIGLNAIMITEKETEREVVLRAEPWVSAASVPLIVVARQEAKSLDHAANPIALTVKGN